MTYTLPEALEKYQQIVDAGGYPDKVEQLLLSALSSDEDKETFRRTIHASKPKRVSESRHPDGRRNWKVVNARRQTAILAKQFQVTRYAMEQMTKLSKFCTSKEQYEGFEKRIMAGTLKIVDAIKEAETAALETVDEKTRLRYLSGQAGKRIKSQWKCILATIRKLCPNSDTDHIAARALRYMLDAKIISVSAFDIVNGRDE